MVFATSVAGPVADSSAVSRPKRESAPRLTEPLRVEPQKDTLDRELIWAQIVAGFAGLGAFIVAAVGAWLVRKQLVESRRQAAVERALAYVQRYAARDFRFRSTPATKFLAARGVEQALDHIKAWREAPHGEEECLPGTEGAGAQKASKNDVIECVDFFEELGTAYSGELLDRAVVESTIAMVTVDFFRASWWFIIWRRGGANPRLSTVYCEQEKMVRAVRNKRRDLRRRFKPKVFGVLAVPEPGANDETWTLYKTFSEALAKGLDTLGANALEQTLGAIDGVDLDPATQPLPHSPSRMRLLYIPRDLGDDHRSWDRNQRLLGNLRTALVGTDDSMIETMIEAIDAQIDAKQPAAATG